MTVHRIPCVLPTLMLMFAAASGAQIPDEFTNLQILPKDISKRKLVGVMRAFAGGLGVRCNHCHVGENVDTLEGFDFASDDKQTKATARVMMRMAETINGDLLSKLGRDHEDVGCYTCHRGLAKPTTLREALAAAIQEGGVEGAKAEYKKLREEHYGRGKYDFGGPSLNGLAERLARGQNDLDGALELARFNLEQNPDFDYGWATLAQLYERKGDKAAAIKAYETLIEKMPGNEWAKQQLARIQSSE